MVKTRSQTGKLAIKQEQDCKSTLLLNNVSNSTGKSKKVKKTRASRRKSNLFTAQKVKMEKDTDTKSSLKLLPTLSDPNKTKAISKDQIDQLINFIVNHNMSIEKASKKASISEGTGYYYYHVYKSDPEKKTPLPRNLPLVRSKCYTQEDIEKLIRYIVDDKMSIMKASAKAHMSYQTSLKYYAKYLKDPNHGIPKPRNSSQKCTQDQITKLISYIVDDKITIHAASLKVDMSYHTGTRYYQKYLNDPDHKIPTPYVQGKRGTTYTQDDIKKFIGYIVDDNMTMTAASKKANMSGTSGSRYYRLYISDPSHDIPSPRSSHGRTRTSKKRK